MTVIGITGSFGTGKTFVASIFKSLGAKVLDADEIAHDAIEKGRPSYKKIVSVFGRTILDRGGQIQRRRLAKLVFADRSCLRRLNDIIHPEVIRIIKIDIARAKRQDVIAIDAPLLVEANLGGMVDYLIVVKASRHNQIKRCRKKFYMGAEEVGERIARQLPLEKKIRMADFVIDNDGARSETRRQVNNIWRRIYGDS